MRVHCLMIAVGIQYSADSWCHIQSLFMFTLDPSRPVGVINRGHVEEIIT